MEEVPAQEQCHQASSSACRAVSGKESSGILDSQQSAEKLISDLPVPCSGHGEDPAPLHLLVGRAAWVLKHALLRQ